jgi:hypothetical protein
MNGSGRASANTRAVAPFRNHGLSLRVTMSRTKTEPITPPNCNASRWGTDANAGHEGGGVLILGGGHSFAGVDQHPLANGGLELKRGPLTAVLNILAAVDDRPSMGLSHRDGAHGSRPPVWCEPAALLAERLRGNVRL